MAAPKMESIAEGAGSGERVSQINQEMELLGRSVTELTKAMSSLRDRLCTASEMNHHHQQ